MTDQEYKLRVAMFNERKKLVELKDPRIVITHSSDEILTEIDFWCEGDEREVERIDKLTRKYRMTHNKLVALAAV